jgi:hypothetical protein
MDEQENTVEEGKTYQSAQGDKRSPCFREDENPEEGHVIPEEKALEERKA